MWLEASWRQGEASEGLSEGRGAAVSGMSRAVWLSAGEGAEAGAASRSKKDFHLGSAAGLGSDWGVTALEGRVFSKGL